MALFVFSGIWLFLQPLQLILNPVTIISFQNFCKILLYVSQLCLFRFSIPFFSPHPYQTSSSVFLLYLVDIRMFFPVLLYIWYLFILPYLLSTLFYSLCMDLRKFPLCSLSIGRVCSLIFTQLAPSPDSGLNKVFFSQRGHTIIFPDTVSP